MSDKKPSKLGGGCLGLFGAVFVAAGLIPGGMGVSMLMDSWQAASWTPTPATLTQIELTVSRDSDGGDTYALKGQFRYEADGMFRQSDRIDFSVGNDNIGDYHQDTYDRLRPLLDVPEGVTAYVNPERPDEAVLIRDIRWGMVAFLMIFLLVFGGAGGGVIAMAVVGSRKLKASNALQAAHPEEPWRWEPEWESGEIPCSGKAVMIVMCIIALVWNLISMSVWLFVPDEVRSGNLLALLALIFPLVGLGLAWYAGVCVLRWRRYGRSLLVLEDQPVRLGGNLTGYLNLSPSLTAKWVDLTLTCTRVRSTGSGKNRKTTREVIYQDDMKAQAQAAGGYRKVPVAFPVPADQPERDVSHSRHKIEWELTAVAKVAGPDLNVSFDLPVFEAPMLAPLSNLGQIESPDVISNGDNVQPRYREHDVDASGGDPEATGVEIHYRGGGLRYYFPPGRHRGIGIGFTVVGAIMFFVVPSMMPLDDLPVFALLICSLIGGVFLVVGLNELMMRSELQARIGQLGVRRGWWLGTGEYYRNAEIDRLALADGMQAGNTRYYRIMLHTKDGKSRVLAGGLKGRRNTQALINRITDSLSLRDQR